MGQRVRRLSSSGGEDRGEGEGPEEVGGGETAEGDRREERRRQAQQLQIHRELQNVEVILHVQLFFFFRRPCLQILENLRLNYTFVGTSQNSAGRQDAPVIVQTLQAAKQKQKQEKPHECLDSGAHTHSLFLPCCYAAESGRIGRDRCGIMILSLFSY